MQCHHFPCFWHEHHEMTYLHSFFFFPVVSKVSTFSPLLIEYTPDDG